MQSLLQVREQAAVAHHLRKMRRQRLAGDGFSRIDDADVPSLEIDFYFIARANLLRLRAEKRRQPQVERIAVEEPGEGFSEQGGYAELLQRGRRLLARRAGAEVAAADHHVAGLGLLGKISVDRFQAM